ncbi:MAG: hypothetical protein ABSB32_21845 [Thermodesulfobacteriota bacterium]
MVSLVKDEDSIQITRREMFQRSLTEVDKIFSNNLHTEFTLDQWREKQHIFLPIFSSDTKPLVDICATEPFNNIFEFSKSEYVISQLNHSLIIEFRIRPRNEYYKTAQKPIPQPDNPKGPNATGIELCIGAYRGISKNKIIYPPFVEIRFEIWGHKERKEFIFFYKNYRRPMEILLKDLELEFFTSSVFKNLEKYNGTDIIRKLNLYVSNKEDPEAYFSLGKTFNKNSEFDRVAKVFRNLLVIYYCCCGYCQERKELDRILDFSDILID